VKRWLVLLASVLMQVCLGSIYAWSTFAPSLKHSYGLTAGQSGLVFGVTIAVFTLAMVCAGRLQDARGPRLVAAIGAVLFGSGYVLASYSGGSFALLLLGVGLLAGMGTGFGYVCPLATGIKWFPRNKGLITGVAVAGFGGGAILLSNLAERMLTNGLEVLSVFGWIGICYGLVILASAMFLFVPAPPRPSAQNRESVRNLLARPQFLALLLGMFAGTFGGLLVVGNLKPLGLAAGLPSATAAAAVGAFAVGNATGRLGWGFIYDRAGRVAIPLSLLLLMAGVLSLLWAVKLGPFLCVSGLIGFGFGACFVLYAAQVAALFGSNRLGTVYPIIFLAYGLSGLTGPAVGGWIYDVSRSYAPAILMASLLLALGAAGTWLLMFQGRPSVAAEPLRSRSEA